MDLHFTSEKANDSERAAVDAIVAASATRDLLLPALHAIQDRIGWISAGALNYICERLSVPPAQAYGVATFYELLSTKPQPATAIRVCDDIACMAAGAGAICATMEEHYGPAGSVSREGGVTWHRSPCLGACDRAPAAFVTSAGERPVQRTIAPLRGAHVPALSLHADGFEETLTVGGTHRRLLRRIGRIDPRSLNDYRAQGGYAALQRAFQLGAQGVAAEISASKLLGRGGAAFPAGRKIEAVARAAARPHYIVCNADESEPGTFKDRILMENDPFAIVEALTIAAFAAECERGYIYVRGEYPLALERMARAVEEARTNGLLGERIMGTHFSFDVELRRGAGAYICGEETALFNSIEGKRGEPRNKPPFPVEHGLFGKPTLVNNVETLACIPEIVLGGGEAFAAIGTPGSTGTKLFCVSGCVARPGLYEVAFGATLAELIDLAGGLRPGRTLRTILLGGAAGTFVAAESLLMPLTFEATRAAGASLGSGVIMVFDDSIDIVAIVKRIAQFFRDESCGQCVPCRVGTMRQLEALDRADLALLNDIARVMRDASICGLGQTAASAVESALTLHILDAGGAR